MIILSLTNHNESSAAIYNSKTNEIYAVSEERFSRIKNCSGNPEKSIRFLLSKMKIDLSNVDKIFYCSHRSVFPNKKFYKQIIKEKNSLNNYDKKVFIKRFNTEVKFNRKYILNFKKWLKKYKINKKKVSYLDHHEAHARSAIICQKKKRGFVLTADGKGGFTSSALWKFDKDKLSCLVRNSTFNSLGYFYGNITIGLGFKAERHEGKVTGLSSFGTSINQIGFNKVFKIQKTKILARNVKKNFIPFFLRGKNKFDISEFNRDIKIYSKEDIAATSQCLLEKIFNEYIKINVPSYSNLLLSGGIFANVKLNKSIKEINLNRYLFVSPPMSDTGLCLGGIQKYTKKIGLIKDMYLGCDFTDYEILKIIKKQKNLKFKIYNDRNNLFDFVVKKLNNLKLFGIFDSKMEFGPRSLGNRSIIFSATNIEINKIVNKRLNRSDFMPFAPVTIDKFVKKNFLNFKKFDDLSKFMTVTYKCTKYFIKKYKAACHIDGTARPQVLYEVDNPWFYKILKYYYKKTKNTCLMNTSFNNHEEPIVCSPSDAIKSLMRNNVDYIIFNKKILVFKNNLS